MAELETVANPLKQSKDDAEVEGVGVGVVMFPLMKDQCGLASKGQGPEQKGEGIGRRNAGREGKDQEITEVEGDLTPAGHSGLEATVRLRILTTGDAAYQRQPMDDQLRAKIWAGIGMILKIQSIAMTRCALL